MFSLEFEALATQWAVVLHTPTLPKQLFTSIQSLAQKFENDYSRFKEKNLLTKINSAKETVILNHDLLQMFTLGKKLSELTENHYTLAIAPLLDSYGYNSSYTLKPDAQNINNFSLASYDILSMKLKKQAPHSSFDLGSLGKGYLIDLISEQIKKTGITNFIIDGGGDMYGTQKGKNIPWNIALSHPTNNDTAIGTLKLKNTALAVSGSDKRRFGTAHHLLDPKSKQPVNTVLSVYVHAKTALLADASATALFVSPEKYWSVICKELNIEYLVVKSDFTYVQSQNFQGTLFS